MKIKTKKQLNLPQLIEWGFNNPELVKGKLYLTKEHDEYSPYVRFSVDGYGVRTGQSINNNDTFTVEVEEVVTEKTEFELMIEITDSYPNCLWEEASVKDWKDEDSKEFHAYIDGEFKLIWTRENGLVE
ncbi:hypothetical protein [Staphylococcus arlettae]|uniref:hypothetical protein n=1 Tax=Staphylococcus arlettae TaxID=29378 RepID=UPI0021D1D27C|nr:hypothetical protein [Staphylococcus arlettae]UXU51828.1 hypothetical protein MUA71_09775 [Staphylococcus arlettae]